MQVQKWLGHHKPSFTLDTYVHLLDEDVPEPDFFDALTARETIRADQHRSLCHSPSAGSRGRGQDNARLEPANELIRAGSHPKLPPNGTYVHPPPDAPRAAAGGR